MKSHWIPLATALVLASAHANAPGDTGNASVLVTLTSLREGGLPHTVEAYGVAQAPPSASRSLVALTSETVEQVLVQDGMEVAAGAPLLRVRPSSETASGYTQAQSSASVADQHLQSTRQLYAQHLATSAQLADAQKADDDAQATLHALRSEGAGGAQILRAPFHAVISHVTATTGMLAAAGAPLLDLAKPDALVLKLGVGAANAMQIGRGDPVRVNAPGDTRQCTGAVLDRGSMIDPATGLVPVEVSLPPHCLLAGETARAAISTGQIKGYVVPHAALLVDDHGAPYVVQADRMKARKVSVQLLGSQGDQDVIQGDDLKPSQQIVVSGSYQLDDGMAMRIENTGKGAQ